MGCMISTAYPTCSDIFKSSKQSSKLVGLFSLKRDKRVLRALASSFASKFENVTAGGMAVPKYSGSSLSPKLPGDLVSETASGRAAAEGL